jgi:RimJ/RimL family protein N-acetyltransferase
VLRLYQPGDAAAMLEAIDESRAELGPWMAWAPAMRALADAERFIERAATVEQGDAEVILGIYRRSDGRFLGGTGYHDIDWRVPKMSIGYWMRRSGTGKGYVRETVAALTRVGFEQLGLRRLEITCAGTNDRSRRVAEACGYQLEGRLRNDERLPDGSLRDTLVFSLIDTDRAVHDLRPDPA